MNWYFWTVVLKTSESPLGSKEIKPVNLKGNQPWIVIERTDAEVEAPILWPPDLKRWFTGKDPDAGKNWRQKVKGAAEDKIIRYHHWLNGHEFEQILGDSVGQGSLACYSPWNRKESNMTWGKNNNQSGRHLSVTSQTLFPATCEAEISLMTKGLKTKGIWRNLLSWGVCFCGVTTY